MSAISTTCPYCGVGCGVSVSDGLPKGDSAHPANFGRLCSKGAALKETLGLADRLTQPMMHGEAVSWDTALDAIAAEFSRIRAQYGPDAIAFYVSGQLLTEDYYVANKLMKGFIGSGNIDTNSRLCMASSVAGHVRAFGEDVVPGCYEDLEEADLVVAVGSNMAWCHPVLYQRLMAARERRGTRIVAVDPRRTATAQTADLHLKLEAGSDVLLFNGLLAYLADQDVPDRDWTQRHVTGFEAAVEAARVSAPSLAGVAAGTGLAQEDVQAFYELFARTERVVTLYSQGVNQSVAGTDKVNAIINCHLATGRIGRAGMGPFSLTGQPNAMGGREVGGLANQLAAHMGFAPEHVDRVRRFWNAPDIARNAGLKAVDMFEAVGDGRIKAIWIAATNPAASMPRTGKVREALANCPLVIAADAWPTDTTGLAHIVLPAAAWSEKDGTVTNSERCISRQRAFRAAPGEARPDWWMFAEVGRRMGAHTAFSFSSAAEIFREHAALSAFENDGSRLFNLGALAEIDDDGYGALAPIQWPSPKAGQGATGARLFARGGFPTPDGKARMIALAPGTRDTGGDVLVLNTGRIRDQWHTMTRTGRVPQLMSHVPGPRLTLHPADAAQRNIAEEGLVRLENALGSFVLRAELDTAVRPGEAFVPMHWTDQFSSSGPADRLVHHLTDPISGQPDLKGSKVRAAPVAESWRGYLLRRSAGTPALGDAVYWSRAPLASGHAFDLGGWTALDHVIDSEIALRRLLQISAEAELISYSDPRKAVFRYAGLVHGRLDACVFFAAPGADLSGIDQAQHLLGREISPAERLALLAGLNAAPGSGAGKIVCACFSVDEKEICTAIDRQKFTTVTQIGHSLRAGTNCGSCIPELKKLLLREAVTS